MTDDCQNRLQGFVAGVANGGIPEGMIDDAEYQAGYADGRHARDQYCGWLRDREAYVVGGSE